jgi:hypothetical protein
MEIRLQSMMPELLRLAFSITGIFPFNDTLFTDDDFAPAKSFSNSMHVPQSFPAEVPTSSPTASDASDMELSSNESDSAEDVAEDAPAAQTHFSWETDSDDFNDEHPSYLTASASAATPTEALTPSRLIVPAAVPITGTIISPSPLMHATRTTLASWPHVPRLSLLRHLLFPLHPLCPIMWAPPMMWALMQHTRLLTSLTLKRCK